MSLRKFELKTLKTKNNRDFIYRDVLSVLINTPEEGRGILVSEMRALIKLLDKIETANGAVYLTNDEWTLLKNKANKFPWGVASREILSFVDDLESAPEVNEE